MTLMRGEKINQKIPTGNSKPGDCGAGWIVPDQGMVRILLAGMTLFRESILL